jgi:predicted outer membrane repeat protein
VMKAGIILRSETGDPGCVIIDAMGKGRVITCVDVDVTAQLSGLTLVNGLATGSYPLDLGGGLFCENSSPQITRCVFSGNHGNYGGGAYLKSGSSPAFAECIFMENMSETMGGGLFCYDSSAPSLVDCTFSANVAVEDGGGLYCSTLSAATVSRCTFYGNDAPLGSGISCFNESACNLTSALIAFGVQGRAIHYDVGSTPILTCCDLYGNSGGDWIGSLSNQLGSEGNIESDPLMCSPDPTSELDWTIQNISPCAADQSTCGLIGAWDVGCTGTATVAASWGSLKAQYR